jgi:multicomponent Na+:H+ antiporter subunit F
MSFEEHGLFAWVVNGCFVVLIISIFGTLIRLLRGPSYADYVIALDFMAILSVATVALYSIYTGQPIFLDAAIALALVAFLATVAFARYIEHRSDQKGPPDA